MYISAGTREYVQALQKAEGARNTGHKVVSEGGGESARDESWALRKFKIEFYQEVEKIQKSDKLDMLVVNVTDEGWARMMEDPEYCQDMLDLIRRDTTGVYIGQVDMVVTIGGTREEYRADSWSVSFSKADRSLDRDSYVERRKRRKRRQKALEEYMWQKHMQEKSMIASMAKKRAGMPAGEVFVADSMLDILRKYNNNFLYM